MNHIYKIVWNASLGAWVAVSELAKSHTKTKSVKASVVLISAIVGSVALPAHADLIYDSNGNIVSVNPANPSTNASVNSGETGDKNNVVIGKNAKTDHLPNSDPTQPTITTDNAVVLGTNSFVQGLNSIAIGMGATVKSDKPGISSNSIAFGANAKVKGGFSTALGSNADAGDGAGMLAVGDNASTNNKTVGSATYSVDNQQSVALGSRALAWGDQAIALGNDVKASGNSSVAIGGDDIDRVRSAYHDLYQNITGQALPSGYVSTESAGGASVAVGVMASSKGQFSTAIGIDRKSVV